MISKKLISHFDVNVYAGIVWILKQFKAFVLKNLIEQESAKWKPALIPRYLLSRILLFYYIQLWVFFAFFNQSGCGFHLNWVINMHLH